MMEVRTPGMPPRGSVVAAEGLGLVFGACADELSERIRLLGRGPSVTLEQTPFVGLRGEKDNCV